MVTTIDALVQRIEAHCADTGEAISTFGRRTVNDGKLVKRLKAGGSVTVETLRRIETALSERTPGVAA